MIPWIHGSSNLMEVDIPREMRYQDTSIQDIVILVDAAIGDTVMHASWCSVAWPTAYTILLFTEEEYGGCEYVPRDGGYHGSMVPAISRK
jgi:hypothetical protein